MKWVKANEKIPDSLDKKHFRKSGTNVPVPYRTISLYDSFEKNFIRFWINPFDIKIISIKELEWLDEETETHDVKSIAKQYYIMAANSRYDGYDCVNAESDFEDIWLQQNKQKDASL